MIPSLPFEEAAIVMTTMTTGVQTIYFMFVIILNLLGLYIQDMQIDKEKAKTTTNGDKPYELEWKELAPYAIVSAIFTMAIFEIYEVQFWHAMVFAVLMGMTFRAILPKIVTLFADKAQALIGAIFGKG